MNSKKTKAINKSKTINTNKCMCFAQNALAIAVSCCLASPVYAGSPIINKQVDNHTNANANSHIHNDASGNRTDKSNENAQTNAIDNNKSVTDVDTNTKNHDTNPIEFTENVDIANQLKQKLIDSAYYFYTDDDYDGVDTINPSIAEQPETLDKLTNTISSLQRNKQRDVGKWLLPQEKDTLLSQKLDTESADDTLATDFTDSTNSQIQPTDSTGYISGFRALADYGYYDNKRYAELSGNVLVQQEGQSFSADKVAIDLKTKSIKAEGQVFFNDNRQANDSNINEKSSSKDNSAAAISNIDNKQTSKINNSNKLNTEGLIGYADTINYNTDTKTASAQDFAFASIDMQAHGYAKAMKKHDKHKYSLDEVMFSTCPPTKLNWKLDANNINFDTKTGRGEAYNNLLTIRDIPVLYLPYFNFPINDQRSSGFLLPKINLTPDYGVELTTPYYFNIATNFDATLTPRIFSDRNPMLEAEFRYLTPRYGQGQLNTTYLAKDRKYDDKDRGSLFFNHQWQAKSWQLKENDKLTVNVQYNQLSDIDYNNDFDYLGSVDNNLNLPRKISIDYNNPLVDAQLKLETFQNLVAKDIYGNYIQDRYRPYARLPQLLIEYQLPKLQDIDYTSWKQKGSFSERLLNNKLRHNHVLNNLQIDGVHDSAYFQKSIRDGSDVEKSGFRMYNKIRASYPVIQPWGYIKPSINLQSLVSSYDKKTLDERNITAEDGTQSVVLPSLNIDTKLSFSKQGAPNRWFHANSGGYQLLEPRLKYTYAPYRIQNNIPNFNTRIASVNYEQLFADTWFLGHDRLQDLHAITPAINYRYIDKIGNTRIDASLAQQFYLDKGQVSLDDVNENIANASDNNVDNDFDKEKNKLFSRSSSGMVASLNLMPYSNLSIDSDIALTSEYELSYLTNKLRYKLNPNTQFTLEFTKRLADSNTDQKALSAISGSAIFPINQRWRLISQSQYDYERNKLLESLFGVDYEDCCVGFTLYGRRYVNDFDLDSNMDNAIKAELRLKGLSDKSSAIGKLLNKKIIDFKKIDQYWKRNQ